MKNKVLAATSNSVTKNKMFTVMIDIPYCLLPELLEYKELTITYKKIEDITLQEVLDNPYIPIWTKSQGEISKITEEQATQIWESSLFENYKSNVLDKYTFLRGIGIKEQNTNLLLIPFAYTTCIITGSNWKNFFDKLCPNYYSGVGYYKSKKQYCEELATIMTDYNNDYWVSVNESTTLLELQNITETIYDLYQEVEWKETEYHIPFKEDIVNFYGEYFLFSYVSDYLPDEEFEKFTEEEQEQRLISHSKRYYDLIKTISTCMCESFSYILQIDKDEIETLNEYSKKLACKTSTHIA